MLRHSVQRLWELWPGARIDVLTFSAERLERYCPGTTAYLMPLNPGNPRACERHWTGSMAGSMTASRDDLGTRFWTEGKGPLERAFRTRASALQARLIADAPAVALELMRGRRRRQGLYETICQANLVVATGGGYLTSMFPGNLLGTLSTLTLAADCDTPTALLGQGLGPIDDPGLRRITRRVFRGVGLIALRERRAGLPLLRSLGIAEDRIMVSGDDAIEAAHALRPPLLGSELGIGLRVTGYSGIDATHVARIKVAMQRAARHLRVSLVPLPISFHDDEDANTLQELTSGYGAGSNGGRELQEVDEVVLKAGQCRVVVAGSYHAGVFALSQGVTVVGLARSSYYMDKFMGLADQFGAGCIPMRLDGPGLEDRLYDAILLAWASAEVHRTAILEAAVHQVDAGRRAYARLRSLVKV